LDIDKLRVPDPEKDFPLNVLLEATRIMVRETRGRVFVSGRADQGPMALAAALCGPENLLLMAADPRFRPKVHQLLDICSRTNIVLGEAQKRAGAHGTCIGVYGTTLISPAMFDELEFPRVRAFCSAMKSVGLRPFIHLCGRETRLLPRLVESGAECLELDPLTDPAATKPAARGRVSVFGMLDPVQVLYRGGVDDVRRHAAEILGIMAPGGGFILGPGCALPEDTPPANIHAVLEMAARAGVYRSDGTLAAAA
jgi:uroporphyrinogen decarboxylase